VLAEVGAPLGPGHFGTIVTGQDRSDRVLHGDGTVGGGGGRIQGPSRACSDVRISREHDRVVGCRPGVGWCPRLRCDTGRWTGGRLAGCGFGRDRDIGCPLEKRTASGAEVEVVLVAEAAGPTNDHWPPRTPSGEAVQRTYQRARPEIAKYRDSGVTK
jgi:hypothetical protein